MIHYFDVEIAERYGVNAAVILQNFAHWIKHNEANKLNYFDGNYWTYNSKRAFAQLFPYLSEKQIGTALSKLIEDGVIITGNYNQSAYDRTLWYALTEKGKSILHFGTMEDYEMDNGIPENVRPIPDNKPYNKPDNKPYKKTASRFTPPTLEEVKAYCIERQNNVDAERFVNYYTANGWKVGKNSMKDWKAAVRTWEKNNYNKAPAYQKAPVDNDLDAILQD